MKPKIFKNQRSKIEELEREFEKERKLYQEKIRELEEENRKLKEKIIELEEENRKLSNAYKRLEQTIENPKDLSEYICKKFGIGGSMDFIHNLLNEIYRIKNDYVREIIKKVGEENYIREVAIYKFGNLEAKIITSEKGIALTSREIDKYVKMEKENDKYRITIYVLQGYRENSTGFYVNYVYYPESNNPLVSKRIKDALIKAFTSEGFYVRPPGSHFKFISLQPINEEDLKRVLERFVKDLMLPNL